MKDHTHTHFEKRGQDCTSHLQTHTHTHNPRYGAAMEWFWIHTNWEERLSLPFSQGRYRGTTPFCLQKKCLSLLRHTVVREKTQSVQHHHHHIPFAQNKSLKRNLGESGDSERVWVINPYRCGWKQADKHTIKTKMLSLPGASPSPTQTNTLLSFHVVFAFSSEIRSRIPPVVLALPLTYR